jgi:uncharacterized membrane protein
LGLILPQLRARHILANPPHMTSALSVKESLLFGWNAFKKRPWFFIGVIVILVLVQWLVGYVQRTLGPLGFLVSLAASTLLYCGILHLFLTAYEDVASATYKDLWYPKPFLNYLGVSILLMLIVGVGLILLVVPGIILGLMLFAAGYLVVDRGMKPIPALKESLKITKGNRWKLFLLGLTIVGLTILGMLPFFLGLLVVAPISALAGVHAYRTLAHHAGEMVASTPSV